MLALLVTLLLVSFSAHAATRTHAYFLNGTYADQFGGPPITPTGNGALGVDGYYFNPGDGPALSNAANATNYSVELLFYIKNTNSWRKLLDFKNRTTDSGLYCYNGLLQFYPLGQGSNFVFRAGQLSQLVLTRSASSALVSIYLDGVPQFSFVDSAQDAVLTGVGRVLHILRDDATTSSENPLGFLDRVQIFDGALAPTEVTALYNANRPRMRFIRGATTLSILWTNLPVAFEPEIAAQPSPELWTSVPYRLTTNGLVTSFFVTNIAQQPPGFFRLREAP